MINTSTLPQLEQISKEHYVFVVGEWGKVQFESKLHHKSQELTNQAINSKTTCEHYLLHQTGMNDVTACAKHSGPFMELNGISKIPENATKFQFSFYLN